MAARRRVRWCIQSIWQPNQKECTHLDSERARDIVARPAALAHATSFGTDPEKVHALARYSGRRDACDPFARAGVGRPYAS